MLQGFGAQRTWVFGSLVNNTFAEGSDIDIAVEGLPRVHYFDALAYAMDLLRSRVDLVRLEDAVPSLVERVLAEGQLL
jgi:predicted nucleotidyltransferase